MRFKQKTGFPAPLFMTFESGSKILIRLRQINPDPQQIFQVFVFRQYQRNISIDLYE